MSSTEEPLLLQFLGSFSATRSAQAVPPPRARKVLLLLAILILRDGQAVDRSFLTGTLWPDSGDREGAMSLRQTLTGLREWLGPDASRLRSPNRQSVAFDLHEPGVSVDVLAFDRAVQEWEKQGRIAAAEAAVALYRGPLLDGNDDLFLMGERTRRSEQCREMLAAIARRSLAEGDTGRAIRLARRSEQIAPLSQTAQRILYEALAKSGDLAATLRAYRDFRILLRRETAMDPDAETVRLVERLRSESPTPPAPVSPTKPVRLPVFLTPFVGREAETASLVAELSGPTHRLLTLTGIGGVGKTRLAVAIARQIGDAFFVDLSAFPPNTTETALFESILRAADDTLPPPNQSPRAALATRLEEHPALVVLDNCEQVIPTISRVADAVLKDAPFCRILATSRVPLGVQGEIVRAVSPFSPEEAVALFLQRAQAVRLEAVTDGNRKTITEICHLLEGIPLAIEMAAARLRALSVDQLRERLSNRLAIIGTAPGSTIAPERQRTMRATLEWSYDLLSENERCLLRRLSVFRGGWTLEAAESVCPGGSIAPEEIPDLLTGLTDKSLVIFDDRSDAPRYRLLEIIHQFASEKLAADSDGNTYRLRHLEFFLSEAKQRNLPEAERDNLWEATTFTPDLPEVTEQRLDLMGSIYFFLEARGYFREGMERAKALLSTPPATQRTVGRACTLHCAGNCALQLGAYDVAETFFEEAQAIYTEREDRRGSAITRENQANLAMVRGDMDTARRLHEQNLRIKRESGTKKDIASGLLNFAFVLCLMGDYKASRPLLEESLILHREIEDKRGLALTLNNLGVTAHVLGDLPAARASLEEAVRNAREAEEKSALAMVLNSLADLVRDQGERALARSLYGECLTIHRRSSELRGIVYALEALAAFYAEEETVEKAARLWGAAWQMRDNVGFPIAPAERERYDTTVSAARQRFGEASFERAWQGGRSLSAEQAIELALNF